MGAETRGSRGTQTARSLAKLDCENGDTLLVMTWHRLSDCKWDSTWEPPDSKTLGGTANKNKIRHEQAPTVSVVYQVELSDQTHTAPVFWKSWVLRQLTCVARPANMCPSRICGPRESTPSPRLDPFPLLSVLLQPLAHPLPRRQGRSGIGRCRGRSAMILTPHQSPHATLLSLIPPPVWSSPDHAVP